MSLEVTDLTVDIDGRRVVDGVSFEVPDGARVGLIGESGSGKSLTALAILGLLPDGAVAGGQRAVGRPRAHRHARPRARDDRAATRSASCSRSPARH